jgi:hypothetical protein
MFFSLTAQMYDSKWFLSNKITTSPAALQAIRAECPYSFGLQYYL